MSGTLIIVNANAANGRAGDRWKTIEPFVRQYFSPVKVAITNSSDEVELYIQQAYETGLTCVISIGGDGTNHSVINALIAQYAVRPNQPSIVYGMLPVGTGQDWARSTGIPFDMQAAVYWLANATPTLVDVGQVSLENQAVYFLNIASVGISGDVVTRVEQSSRRPWSFLTATIRSLLSFQPPTVQIRLDNEDWYEGTIYLVAIANGTTFGRGMKIAPLADSRDGLLDVVVVEAVSWLRALDVLRRVYDGSHLEVESVHYKRATSVEIMSHSLPLSMELDGEFAQGRTLKFTVRQGLLKLLT